MTADDVLRRGDVVVSALAGDYGKPRPAVVVQSDLFNPTHASVTLCPMSSEITGLDLFRIGVSPAAANGLRQPSEVMVDKVGAVARQRIRGRIGRLSGAQMKLVDRALRVWLDLAITQSNP